MNCLVLVLSFDHLQLTKRCLMSVQKFFRNEQIVLIHNGSTISNINELKKDFPSIFHLIVDNNSGYASGMNTGLKYFYQKRSIPWCLALTNDTELLSYNSIVEQSDMHLIAPLIYYRSLVKVDSWGGSYDLLKGKLYHHKGNIVDPEINDIEKFYVPGTAFFVNRKVFELGIYFDENLNTFWEDVYWSAQIKKKGLSISRSNLISLSHAGGKTTRKSALYTSYFYQRNRMIVSLKLQLSILMKLLTFLIIGFEIGIQIIKQVKLGKMDRAGLLIKAIKDALSQVISSKNV
jgi:GT2 family glycosyltransferase